MKSKKIPTLDYGEIDDVLYALQHLIIQYGPISELSFLEGKITKSEIECTRKHRKYLESIMKKLVPILNAHKKTS